MSMKINQVTQAYGVEFQKAINKPKALGKEEKTGRSDSVTVSPKAREKASAAEAENTTALAKSHPEIRQEKVDEVKRKLEEGFYSTPEFTEALADRLMKEFGFEGPKA